MSSNTVTTRFRESASRLPDPATLLPRPIPGQLSLFPLPTPIKPKATA